MEQVRPRVKYFLYARKSSESEDRQVASIDSQIENMKKDAARERLEIVEVLHEARSAKAPGRPVFNGMIKRVYRGEAQGIICWKLDRLARNPVDGGQVSWMLQQGLIKHIRTHERDYYPTDNVLMMSVEFGMANQYVRDLSTSVKRGLRDKAGRGLFPVRPPIGYVTEHTAPKGLKPVLKDPDRFVLVRRVFDVLLTGAYSAPQVHRIATDEWGLRTRRGKKLSLSNFYRMLGNPFYYGIFEFPSGSGTWYRGTHEPLITEQEFDRIQDFLGRKGRMRPQKRAFAFIGTMRCGECEGAVTAEAKTKRQKSGKVHHYVYYHCTRKKNPSCRQRCIEEKPLLFQILRFVDGLRMPPEFYAYALKWFRREHEKESTSQRSIHEARERAYKSSEQKLDKLIDMRAAELITEEEFLRKRGEISRERARYQGAGSQEEDTTLEIAEDMLAFIRDMKDRLQNGTPEQQRETLLALGSNRRLSGRKLLFDLQKPLFSMRKAASVIRWIHSRIEPPRNGSTVGYFEGTYDRIPVLSALLEDVRTALRSFPKDSPFNIVKKWREVLTGKDPSNVAESSKKRPSRDLAMRTDENGLKLEYSVDAA